MLLSGRVENDNYTNKNGEKVYSVRIIAEDIEFAERKSADASGSYAGPTGNGDNPMPAPPSPDSADNDDFVQIDSTVKGDIPFFNND